MKMKKTLRIFISEIPRLSCDLTRIQYAPIKSVRLGKVQIAERKIVTHEMQPTNLQKYLQVNKPYRRNTF